MATHHRTGGGGTTALSGAGGRLRSHNRRRLARAVERHAFGRQGQPRWLSDSRDATGQAMVDLLFAFPGEPCHPDDVFDRLRWGGQFIFISTNPADTDAIGRLYRDRPEFEVDRPPTSVVVGPFGLALPLLCRRVHYFVARKTALIKAGELTDRFTFSVNLTRRHGSDGEPGYVVVKQVPTSSSVYERLRERHPGAEANTLAKRARKLADRVFPVFLTREAAFLKILQRDLPAAFRDRVPRLLHMKQGEDGLVRRIYMTWLRVGGRPISQVDFARQSAELLHAVHETVGIIHLDLRLDNIVITPDGVGFVDFGSAVRIGEDISKNPMLRSLFDEMMSTSQIQRLLGKMKSSGQVTSQFICDAHQKVDKAVDLFYLAMQMVKPHSNPELAPFIEHHPESEEAERLKALTDSILRPKDPNRPPFTCAGDLLRGIERIRQRLTENSHRR